jgi:ABC-2 type transport system permease protein
MKILDKYWSIAVVSARSNVAYLGEVTSRILFLAIILFIFSRLWTVTYAETHASRLADLTLPEMLWYFTLAECIILSAPRVAPAVDEDVRTGSLAVQLIRPVSYPGYRLAVALGERCIRFALNLMVGAAVTCWLVGPFNLQLTGVLFCLLTLPLAFVIDFLGNFLVGLFAFWLEDTSGLLLIYSRFTMILGGMLMPIELFPAAMKPLINALPFSALIYGPAKILIAPSSAMLSDILLRQIVGLGVFGLAVFFLERQALRRIHAQGG